jgi:hypothetical protein
MSGSMDKYLLPAFILLFCAPAFFVEGVLVKPMLILAGLAFFAGALATAWARYQPADFLVTHPALADTPLHPAMAGILGGLLLLFGCGLLLALGSRVLWRYFESSRS